MKNPYTPTQSENQTGKAPRENRLRYLWVWLAATVLGAMLATPASIFEFLAALAFALPSFLIGISWASNLAQYSRWIVTAVCVIVCGLLAPRSWLDLDPRSLVKGFIFAGVNIALGWKACKDLVRKRRQIIVTLTVSYAMGLLLGPIGVVMLTVTSVLAANRIASIGSGLPEREHL